MMDGPSIMAAPLLFRDQDSDEFNLNNTRRRPDTRVLSGKLMTFYPRGRIT